MASESELLAAVYQRPQEDGPRAVYADFLSERQDPRGEFIALQLQSAAHSVSAKHLGREQRLLRRHVGGWLGPLAPLMLRRRVVFRRGFLASGACVAITPRLRPIFSRLVLDPSWATLEVLDVDARHLPDPMLLQRAHLPSLARVNSMLDEALVAQLAVRSRPLERLAALWLNWSAGQRQAQDAIATSPALPALQSLTMTGSPNLSMRWFNEAPVMQRLRHLRIDAYEPPFAPWYELFRQYPNLESLDVGNRPTLIFRRSGANEWLEFHRIGAPEGSLETIRSAGFRGPLVLVSPHQHSGIEARLKSLLTDFEVRIRFPDGTLV